MHNRQASLLVEASELADRVAGKKQSEKKVGLGQAILWKYEDPEGMVFYLEEKKTTVKSPFSGKSFTAKPKKFTPAQVGQEMKEEAKETAKQAAVVDPWKV